MKFAMNGALTIGTLDGANIEIRREVGEENFFLFGLTTDEVERKKAEGYHPWDVVNSNPELKAVLDSLTSGEFSQGDTSLFRPLVDSLLGRDDYMLLADYQAYVDCQAHISEVFRDQKRWTQMSLRNVARIGKFSSDRAIGQYVQDIWRVPPLA